MHQFSDSDTPDSDEGIRFKTDSTRNKDSNKRLTDSSKDRKRRSKSRSRSLERRRNRRRDDRDRSRDRFRHRRRSFSREKRSVSKESRQFSKIKRSLSREHRSTSRDKRLKHKSKETSFKYDRSTLRTEKDQGNKRHSSVDLKEDTNKRKKDLDTSKPTTERTTKSKKSNSKEHDIKKPSNSNSTKEKLTESPKIIKDDIEKSLKSIITSPEISNDLEAFGPALPPKLILSDSIKSEKSTSVSPRRCKHKRSLHKKHSKISSEKAKDLDDLKLDKITNARMDTRTFSKVSTSPISSENSVPEDGLGEAETYAPLLYENNDKFVIEIEDSDIELDNTAYGPNIPQKNEKSTENTCYGPDIAPENEELPSQSVGPFLPDHLRQKLLENCEQNGAADITSLSDDEIEEGEIVGPTLPGSKASFSASQIALEERALQYKLDRLPSANSGSDVKVREDWMLSLPEPGSAAKMGLGPRQFRAKAAPDMSDRSGWTETPKDRETKQRAGKATKEDNGANFKSEAERLEVEERDKEQERLARRHHKKHRKKDKKEKSLLEIHQDKLKIKKKKDEDDQNIRRPFNRDTDLKVNQFDDAQKKAIYKKAQLLDDRFSKGESKYL